MTLTLDICELKKGILIKSICLFLNFLMFKTMAYILKLAIFIPSMKNFIINYIRKCRCLMVKEAIIMNNQELFKFSVPVREKRIDSARDNLSKFERKANDINVYFSYKIAETTSEKVVDFEDRPDIVRMVEGRKVYFAIVRYIEVTHSKFKLGNWELIAKVEPAPSGSESIILGIGEVEGIPSKYRTFSNSCEHCNREIESRMHVFLVKNNNGEFKQVGKTCLKDFTGHDALRSISALAYIRDLKNSKFDDKEFWGNSGPSVLCNETLVGIIHYAINKIGYMSKKAAQSRNVRSTADYVDSMFFDIRYYDDYKAAMNEFESFPEKLSEVREWVSKQPFSEFNNNCRIMLDGFHVPSRYIPWISAVVGMMIESKSSNQLKSNDHYGIIGKRYTEELTYISTKNFIGTDYRYREVVKAIHTFKTKSGELITWFTTNGIFKLIPGKTKDENEYIAMKEGDKQIFAFTVKEHSNYKGIKQTIVSRVAEKSAIPKVKGNKLC